METRVVAGQRQTKEWEFGLSGVGWWEDEGGEEERNGTEVGRRQSEGEGCI